MYVHMAVERRGFLRVNVGLGEECLGVCDQQGGTGAFLGKSPLFIFWEIQHIFQREMFVFIEKINILYTWMEKIKKKSLFSIEVRKAMIYTLWYHIPERKSYGKEIYSSDRGKRPRIYAYFEGLHRENGNF